MANSGVEPLDVDSVTEVEAGGFRESFDSFYRREVRRVVALAYALSGSRSGAEWAQPAGSQTGEVISRGGP